MKPLLLFCAVMLLQTAFAQSLDYISVRKRNGAVVKNFYTGSNVLLQTTDGSYLQGPIQSIRADSVFIVLYDVRYMPTVWGGYLKDTISTIVAGIRHNEIRRLHLNKRKGFFRRNGAPLLMIGGAGYAALNVLNGALYNGSVTGSKNLQRIGAAAGAFGLGYLLHKLFSSDGFSKRTNKIVYVDLKPPKPL